MLVKQRWETDGDCHALGSTGACLAMVERDPRCGTYGCIFYKPKDLKDWVRIDGKNLITMLAPEECAWNGDGKWKDTESTSDSDSGML